MADDVLKPSATLLIKLGSIIVHFQELNSPDGHHFDKSTIDALLDNEDVKQWMEGMNKLALLPVKRKK